MSTSLRTVRGDTPSRNAYRSALVDYFSGFRDRLSADSRTRLEQNPLRILDSKDEGDRKLIAGAPTIYDVLTPEAAVAITAPRAR